MPTDKTGVNLHPGQLVDINLSGMITGTIARVETPRVLIPGQPMTGQVFINIGLTVGYQGNKVPQLYVVHTPKKPLGLVAPDGQEVRLNHNEPDAEFDPGADTVDPDDPTPA